MTLSVRVLLADGASYDSKKNFQYLYDNGIESAIKVRMNSTGQSIKWLLLSEEIDCIEQMKNFKKWKHSISYGHRLWTAETVFSATKRMFGEYIMARKYHPNMVKEMFLKVSLYNNMFVDMKL